MLFRRTMLPPTIDANRMMRPATDLETKWRAHAWARNTAPRVFTAEGAVPLLGRHLEERRRRQRTGRVDEDVEPTVAGEDVCDQLLGSARRGRDPRHGPTPRARAARPPAPARRPEGRRTRRAAPAATNASAQARPMPRWAPVTSATRPSSLHVPGGSGVHTHRSAMTASISTGMSNGRCGTPTDVRAARRSAP